MAVKVRQFPRGIPASMWWGAAAVALIVGAAGFGVDRWSRAAVRAMTFGQAGTPQVTPELMFLGMIVALVAPILLWAGVAARVVPRWWMTGLLTCTSTVLGVFAVSITVELGSPRPMFSYWLPSEDLGWMLIPVLALLSFLAGVLVHGATRWLLIRPQPDCPVVCWNCGYSRRGLPDESVCPECASVQIAPMGRFARAAAWYPLKTVLPTVVVLGLTIPTASVAWNFVRGTLPVLAALRSFGERDLVQATNYEAWGTGRGFVGVGALHSMDEMHYLVLAIPEPRITALMGLNESSIAGQLFVVQKPAHRWVMRGGPWSVASEWDAAAGMDLNERQLQRLSKGLPPDLVSAFKSSATPGARPADRNQIDPRPWLGE